MKKSTVLMFALLLACVFAISGCESSGDAAADQAQQTETIATTCASASAALKVLTVANDAGKLSEDVQYKVGVAALRIQPICGSPNPPTLDAVLLEAFKANAATLAAEAARSP